MSNSTPVCILLLAFISEHALTTLSTITMYAAFSRMIMINTTDKGSENTSCDMLCRELRGGCMEI